MKEMEIVLQLCLTFKYKGCFVFTVGSQGGPQVFRPLVPEDPTGAAELGPAQSPQ